MTTLYNTVTFNNICPNEKSLMKYYATELQRAILSLKEREEVSLDGAFAGLAMKSCLESNVYPQLESMYSSFWNSPPEPDICHACKVPFCKSCVDTTNC